MDILDTDRCESIELDEALRLQIKASNSTHDGSHCPTEQTEEVNTVTLQLRITQLERQREELIRINRKWSTEYQSLRQHYDEMISAMRKILAESEKWKKEVEEGSDGRMRRRNMGRVPLLSKYDVKAQRGVPENPTVKVEEMWRHQAEVYKEDFLKEHRDKNRLQEKYMELEKKFTSTLSELKAVKKNRHHSVNIQVDWTQFTPGKRVQNA